MYSLRALLRSSLHFCTAACAKVAGRCGRLVYCALLRCYALLRSTLHLRMTACPEMVGGVAGCVLCLAEEHPAFALDSVH